jgi:AAA ATPase domain
MAEYTRTAIRRLSISGFRSIRSVDLLEIPDLVVLHGPNGAGKSNLLLAAQLVLDLAALPGLPVGSERPGELSLKEADTTIELRPEDFHYPGLPEIRVAIEVELGTRAAEIVRVPDRPLGRLSMEVVIQLPTDKKIRYWFERALLDGAAVPDQGIPSGTKDPGWRIRELLPSLVQVSRAYRVPGGADDPEEELYRKCLSDNRLERGAIRRLGRRLASAGLFGASAEPVELVPVDDKRYEEHRILLTHPTHGDLPLRNLGSGEQQLVYMLAQRVISAFPIAHIEEPEAHLHTTLMEPFARILHESVTGNGGPPDVDQLWIATHHHHFALALEYFDVQLVGGETVVTPKPRAKAATNFYEPGPIWEALRQLAMSAKTQSAVVFRGADGAGVTAAQILDSIENDPEQRVAKEYAREMTEAMVLAMRQRAETQK